MTGGRVCRRTAGSGKPPAPHKGAAPAAAPKRHKSAFRGVTLHCRTDRFEAHICHGGSHIHLGGCDTERQAALAYDLAAVTLLGEAAHTNFDIADYARELAERESVRACPPLPCEWRFRLAAVHAADFDIADYARELAARESVRACPPLPCESRFRLGTVHAGNVRRHGAVCVVRMSRFYSRLLPIKSLCCKWSHRHGAPRQARL